ncbi:hypothetical protein I4U23_017583 [Adineta vaga]|nr:hypothetical protein I4U23_017583 [Adineta vaga]
MSNSDNKINGVLPSIENCNENNAKKRKIDNDEQSEVEQHRKVIEAKDQLINHLVRTTDALTKTNEELKAKVAMLQNKMTEYEANLSTRSNSNSPPLMKKYLFCFVRLPDHLHL